MLLGDDEVREMALDHVSTWAGWQVGRAGMGWEQGMLLPSGSGLLSRLVKTRKARASGQARPGKQATALRRPLPLAGFALKGSGAFLILDHCFPWLYLAAHGLFLSVSWPAANLGLAQYGKIHCAGFLCTYLVYRRRPS